MRLQQTTSTTTTAGSTTPPFYTVPLETVTPLSGDGHRTAWPDTVAFREAIQNPGVALGDPELRTAEVVQDRRGLPVAYSGRFAVVFRLRTPSGDEWALRCFTQGGPEDAERRFRYTTVARYLERVPEHFVPFRFIERGIKVGY